MSGKEEIGFISASRYSAAGWRWQATSCANVRDVPNEKQPSSLLQLCLWCDLPKSLAEKRKTHIKRGTSAFCFDLFLGEWFSYADPPSSRLDTAPLLHAARFRVQTACPRHCAHRFFLQIGCNYSNYLTDTILFKEAFFTKLDSEPPSQLRVYTRHCVVTL